MSEHSTNHDVKKFVISFFRFFLERHVIKSLRNFLITHLKNSIDLAMNDLCYEYSQDVEKKSGIYRLHSFNWPAKIALKVANSWK